MAASHTACSVDIHTVNKLWAGGRHGMHTGVCALRRESHVCVVVVTVNDFLASVACSVTFD